MKISVSIEFSELDRKIVAFHYGHLGENADIGTLRYFVRREVEHALEFLASDYRVAETVVTQLKRLS